MNEAMTARLALFLAVLLVLSPIDPLPDALPVVGTFDDLVCMYFGLGKYLRYKHSL